MSTRIYCLWCQFMEQNVDFSRKTQKWTFPSSGLGSSLSYIYIRDAMAWHGHAGTHTHGMARHGQPKARHGVARHDTNKAQGWRVSARHGTNIHGTARTWHGTARQMHGTTKAWHDTARHGTAWHDSRARHGTTRHDKARQRDEAQN